uniref:non-specific serine/threonine protein kinase n=1 Tax=Kalanchoe fedtschenkoi TaxID=63787 RepID=A0A7N0TL37_KALFE
MENFTIADFEFDKIYGIGSYSKVVRAKKRDTGVVCALKIMNKMFIIKQRRQACAKLERLVLDQLDHPGIVRLLFTFRDTSSLYMALEACEGGELFDQIVRKGHLSEDEARFYMAEIVEALEYIHEMGLVHRDIKPENLLITADGHIKIADFGCIKPMEDTRITLLPAAAAAGIDAKAGKLVGTAAYMSPEVLCFDSATFGNDLWALGCTLYQMLSGTTPFKDASEWRMCQRILTRDLSIPNHLSEEAKDLIDRLLDLDPARRLGTGPNGYATLKKQPFFKGVNWKNLRSHTPPELALEPSVEVGDDEDFHDSSWDTSHVRWFSAAQSVGSDRSASSSGAPCHAPAFSDVNCVATSGFLGEPTKSLTHTHLYSHLIDHCLNLNAKFVILQQEDTADNLAASSPGKCNGQVCADGSNIQSEKLLKVMSSHCQA